MAATLERRSGLSAGAIAIIRFYQKRLSPHKGFRCAHHAVHGTGSCSDFGLNAFAKRPPVEAWRLLKGRFAECKAAYATLIALSQSEDGGERKEGDAERAGKFCDYVDCIPFDCSPADCSSADCGHVGHCDVGHCDIGHCG